MNFEMRQELVICGTADPLLPFRHARALHEALANSEFLLVEGAGHVPVTESREEVATAVRDFLVRRSLNAGGAHE